MNILSIVIPCYNEKATILELLRRVLAVELPAGWKKEVIVVDDASTDGTRTLLTEAKFPITLLLRDKNGGKGSALQLGLAKATGTYCIIQDADLEYDPQDIPQLVRALGYKGTTVVYGSRNLHHTQRRGFFVQRAGVWVITQLINTLHGLRMTDVWTCYKLFPRNEAGLLPPGRFESELLFTVALARRGHRFAEVPISHHPRDAAHGKKIRYRDGVWAIYCLIVEYIGHIGKPKHYRAKNTLESVVCPFCQGALTHTPETLLCPTHGTFPIDDSGRPLLIKADSRVAFDEEHHSGINWLKSFLKQIPFLYYAVWHVFCPVLMLANGPRRVFRYASKDGLVVDVGSGPERLAKEFVNVDVVPFPEVDIVADAQYLPFETGSVHALVNESVLEHVEDAPAVAKEMMRVLAPGGFLYASIPFIHPYHASPDDFNRYTLSGLKKLFDGLDIVEAGVRSGPWSAFLIFLAYWLGVVFSFGSKKAAPFLAHMFMLILGPLKFLDVLFMFLPGADAVAAHVYIIGRKRP